MFILHHISNNQLTLFSIGNQLSHT
ncbi:hypothetical protein F383_38144 [Gossypium arboreum]|uniref:Uncharacterized protein n=1 Tax=Gossypium arboreum TaxID=29729 RepID=A0A0B0MAF3_GOSAR|nr:hypothetical protein F383_38144 [Gossypium arboreum]